MYTYLENINEVQKCYGFPYNLIGKVKNIELCNDGSILFYRFTLFNDNCDCEYQCVVKESELEKRHLKEYDTIVVKYATIDKFMDMDECLLIRRISKPVFGLTGNKTEDVIRLMEITKKLIESEFKDSALIQAYHSQLNIAYLKFRKTYTNSVKKRQMRCNKL